MRLIFRNFCIELKWLNTNVNANITTRPLSLSGTVTARCRGDLFFVKTLEWLEFWSRRDVVRFARRKSRCSSSGVACRWPRVTVFFVLDSERSEGRAYWFYDVRRFFFFLRTLFREQTSDWTAPVYSIWGRFGFRTDRGRDWFCRGAWELVGKRFGFNV